MNGKALLTVFVVVGLGGASPGKETEAVGRYQLAVHPSGWVFVLDTATGDCWSKPLGGEWQSAGNPTRSARTTASDEPLRLELPEESVELTIRQRRSKVVPGSEGRIHIRIGDITEGQVLLSVRADDGKVLRDDVSVRPEDVIGFSVNGQRYFIRVKELRNILVGQGDFGVFEVSASAPENDTSSESAEGNSQEPAP